MNEKMAQRECYCNNCALHHYKVRPLCVRTTKRNCIILLFLCQRRFGRFLGRQLFEVCLATWDRSVRSAAVHVGYRVTDTHLLFTASAKDQRDTYTQTYRNGVAHLALACCCY